jgi:hypothetical protein
MKSNDYQPLDDRLVVVGVDILVGSCAPGLGVAIAEWDTPTTLRTVCLPPYRLRLAAARILAQRQDRWRR